MKATILALVLASAITDLCAAKEKPKPDNAYRMEMLDMGGKPVATAIIWTPKFEFKERPFYTAKCKLQVLQTNSKEEAVMTFNKIIKKPDEIVEVEVQSFPNSSPDTPPEKTLIGLCVNFNPGHYDYNVKVSIDQAKDGFDASWYCELQSSPKIGGDVKISRIFAEPAATDPFVLEHDADVLVDYAPYNRRMQISIGPQDNKKLLEVIREEKFSSTSNDLAKFFDEQPRKNLIVIIFEKNMLKDIECMAIATMLRDYFVARGYKRISIQQGTNALNRPIYMDYKAEQGADGKTPNATQPQK